MESVFVTEDISGLEVERVLVLEVVDRSIGDLKNAAMKLGIQWLAEIDEKELSLTEASGFFKKIWISDKFFKTNKIVDSNSDSKEIFDILRENQFLCEEREGANKFYWSYKKNLEKIKAFLTNKFVSFEKKIIKSLRDKIETEQKKSISGKLFLFMSNHEGMKQFLAVWKRYKTKKLKHGEIQWGKVFDCLHDIRYWGEEDRLKENNVLDKFREEIEVLGGNGNILFELDFWYAKDTSKAENWEKDILLQVETLGGDSSKVHFYRNDYVGIHLAKVNLPVGEIRKLIEESHYNNLFKKEFVKFVRPAGQSIMDIEIPDVDISADIVASKPLTEQPIIALFDGLPVENHDALKGKMIVDDPDFLGEKYLAEKRVHGTGMASLICNGDLEKTGQSLERKIYVRPIMQPDTLGNESIFEGIFFEDVIEKSVMRMFENSEFPASAPSVRVINLSVCHASRWFFSSVSSGGRLLDWLSWKYKVLFCVSAGNYNEEICCDEEDLLKSTLVSMVENNRNRRLLMPADSINSITTGSLHKDECEDFATGQRVNILPCEGDMPSPISCFGHGFAFSIKPEILLPGGRQLYNMENSICKPNLSARSPGQKVAIGNKLGGSKYAYSRGTSNANALATRGAGLIFEMLEREKFKIPQDCQAVVLKTLLVHGSRQGKMKDDFTQAIGGKPEKKELSKYLGYGVPDIDRVLRGTEKRVTVFGFSSIEDGQRHEFMIPLPASMRGSNKKRTLIVTLSWITPINVFGQKYKSANLNLVTSSYGKEGILHLEREEFDSRQAAKGTVQHDILAGRKEISNFMDGEKVKIPIECTIASAEHKNEKIPYALAVTLETEDEINIYEDVRAAIVIPERVRV